MEDQDADAAMREMMGFGSFGSNKRQKLNPGDQNRSKRPPTTSSNSTPLGTSRIQKDSSSSLSMIPSSLPPSGRSQPGSPVWIAAKLPNAVSTPKIPETNEIHESEPAVDDSLADQPQPSTPTRADSNTITSQPSNSSLNATADTFTPSKTAVSPYSASDIRSDPAYWTAGPTKQNRDNEVEYTSPWTGATLTRGELHQYGRGKKEVQEDGSTVSVFFKPGFLATEEELWGRWERERKVNGTASVV